ncbi:hypothetical protein ES703_90422 [subsurface metagenome]
MVAMVNTNWTSFWEAGHTGNDSYLYFETCEVGRACQNQELLRHLLP